jgi:hypothetical protein
MWQGCLFAGDKQLGARNRAGDPVELDRPDNAARPGKMDSTTNTRRTGRSKINPLVLSFHDQKKFD